MRLPVLRDEAAICVQCRDPGLIYRHDDGRWAYPLFHKDATCPSRIVFVAEAPNLADTFDPKKGRLTIDPDTDPSGRLIFKLLASVGLAPDDVLFTNAVLCLPAKTDGKFPVTARQLELCRPWLSRFIEDSEARVVVTLGGKALDAAARIEKHGLSLSASAGKLHPWFRRSLLPLYHPSALGQVSRSAEQQERDIQALRPLLQDR